jgi:hypothetical protein
MSTLTRQTSKMQLFEQIEALKKSLKEIIELYKLPYQGHDFENAIINAEFILDQLK